MKSISMLEGGSSNRLLFGVFDSGMEHGIDRFDQAVLDFPQFLERQRTLVELSIIEFFT